MRDPVPRAVRGWRSLRYARIEPALSLSVTMRASLPARFVTVWILGPDEPFVTPIEAQGRRLSLAAGTVELNPLGSKDPISAANAIARSSGAG